ncbi:MAG: hypothetical protein J7M19_07605 [Planctomycetes bacterium]|nr:hypothetical protein [Planctomycetota bacterium]
MVDCVQCWEVVAGSDGRWMVRLDSLQASGSFKMVVSGRNTVTFDDVLVGEVWIAAGQSNMRMRVAESANAEEEIATAKYPRLRVCKVTFRTAEEPQDDLVCKWEETSPETAGVFTAAGYFFARAIHQELDVPVGIVNTSWGGSVAEAWMSISALRGRWTSSRGRWARRLAARRGATSRRLPP